MRDDHAIEDMSVSRRLGEISRRRFGGLSIATSLALLLPGAADAAEVTDSDVDIKTPDGIADAYFAHPTEGQHPAVLMWTDNRGLSPTFKAMGKRLAQSGYSVLVPNPYYRFKRAPVIPLGSGMSSPGVREILVPMMDALTAATGVTDAKAFVGFLDSQSSVDKKRKMGTCGYTMICPQAMRTAASFPERVGAVATMHPAGLVTDKPDSPHLLVPKMKASFLIAIAEAVDQREPDAKTSLRQAFANAKLPAEIEVYAGTVSGWCMRDSANYNEAQAERVWSRMLALFSNSLV